MAFCTLFLVFLSVIKFILIKYCNLKSILITVIFHYNNNEINVFSFKLLMSPECDTTTKNHYKIKRDMQIQTEKNAHRVKWIHNFISSCIYMNIYLQDWLSTISWYLSFEHTAKPCLSNFRTNKEIIGLTNFMGKKMLISYIRLFHSNRSMQLYINEYTHHPQSKTGNILIIRAIIFYLVICRYYILYFHACKHPKCIFFSKWKSYL